MSDIFKDLLFKIVDNPINALSSGNYLGILTWAIAGGIALKHCSNEAKQVFIDINEGVLKSLNCSKTCPFWDFWTCG